MVHSTNPVLKSVQLVENLRAVLKHTFSHDVDSDIKRNNLTALHDGFVDTVASQVSRLAEDIGWLKSELKAAINHGKYDDDDNLLSKSIELEASLPCGSSLLEKLSKKSVETLWESLSHPPLSHLGDDAHFRSANGSGNNPSLLTLGQAGSPYVRTVTPQSPRPPNLPDAGLIFDGSLHTQPATSRKLIKAEIMARGDRTREHPTQISNQNISDSSSYLDLAPLYGHNETEQHQVRTMHNGLLKRDTFAEVRLLGFPPGVSALLVSFNRFHNYTATQLAEINENGRFSLNTHMTPDQVQKYKSAKAKRDHDLFQTARLITCGLYVNIIVNDYVRTALNLNRTKSEWSLGSRNSFSAFGQSSIPEGVGNTVSVEFNLIYRWHSAISSRDESWTHDLMKKALADSGFDNLEPQNATLPQTMKALEQYLNQFPKDKPEEWTFGGLKRQENHSFKDSDLADILSSSTEDLAGDFGPRNVPIAMRAIEVLGIEQARNWNVASLNEFRSFFGLTPHKTFNDISNDPSVAESLKALYDHPDNVELYPGIVAENAQKKHVPGAGLCCSSTIIRCILSDAVTLVRGDRFLTVDWTPANVTNWGFNLVASDPSIAGGAVIYKLFMKAFPDHYTSSSAWAFFPFTTPDATKVILKDLGMEKEFTYDRPHLTPKPTSIKTWKGVAHVLDRPGDFKVPWGSHMNDLGGGHFMLASDRPKNHEQRRHVEDALRCPRHWENEMRKLFSTTTTDVLREKSHKMRSGSYMVDLVADIANISHATAVAHLFHLPLKTKKHTIGAFTAQEIYTLFTSGFAYVFTDDDPAQGYALRQAAQGNGQLVGAVVGLVVLFHGSHKVDKALEWLQLVKNNPSDFGTELIHRLRKGGKSVVEAAQIIVPTAGAAVTNMATGLTNMIDLFLSKEYEEDWAKIQELAKSDGPKAFHTLKKYAMEAFRLRPPVPRILRHVGAHAAPIDTGTDPVDVEKDTVLYLDLVSACLDPEKFPDPHKIDVERDEKDYINLGLGSHSCIGGGIVWAAMATQLGIFARLKNLRRAPGPAGTLKCRSLPNGNRQYMTPDWSNWVPYPTTMKVMFDGLEGLKEIGNGSSEKLVNGHKG